ncbi:IGEB protein, partial [Dyaphorophyia castanea]|nr:IGEB protein [Platysteira castanea]
VKHSTGIPHSPTEHSIVKRAHSTIKHILNQQQGETETCSPIERLCKALFTINFLNSSFMEPNPPVFRHFSNLTRAKLNEKLPVLIKDPESWQIPGPFP